MKDAIFDGVKRYTKEDKNVIFSPADIFKEMIKEYPEINQSTLRCQLIADCVNHSSRRHYPSGQQDCYYLINKGNTDVYEENGGKGFYNCIIEKIYFELNYKEGGMAVSNTCPFCTPDNIILSNDLAFVIFDIYPVNKGHLLVIPKRHISDFFETTKKEREAINQLLEEGKALLEEKYKPDGYNIGINCGEAAGQTIFHVHVHLIPRYKGDIDNPRGGVRGVIPEKRLY